MARASIEVLSIKSMVMAELNNVFKTRALTQISIGRIFNTSIQASNRANIMINRTLSGLIIIPLNILTRPGPRLTDSILRKRQVNINP